MLTTHDCPAFPTAILKSTIGSKMYAEFHREHGVFASTANNTADVSDRKNLKPFSVFGTSTTGNWV